MTSFAEIRNLQSKSDGILEKVEMLINAASDEGLDNNVVDIMNEFIAQYNSLSIEVEEVVDVNFSKVEKVRRPDEGELLVRITSIKNGCNRIKNVLEGYKEDLENENSEDFEGIKIEKKSFRRLEKTKKRLCR